MNPDDRPVESPETAALARRVRRMERHLLRMNVAFVSLIVLIVLSAVLVVRWAGSPEAGRYRGKRFGFPHHGTVEGTRFVLVDTLGVERGKFELDQNGIVQLWLGSERRSQPGIGMGLLPDGGSQFVLKGSRGGIRANLMASGLNFYPEDTTSLEGYFGGSGPIASFPIQWQSGATSLMLVDSAGHHVMYPPNPRFGP